MMLFLFYKHEAFFIFLHRVDAIHCIIFISFYFDRTE